ncbi:MAG TPA: hypothetical protein VGJ82_00105 [Thermoanaerobaculia bacterium]|jgi:hypothetical protein
MEQEQIVAYAKRLAFQARDINAVPGVYAAAAELLRTYAGPNTSFLAALQRGAPDVRMAGAYGFCCDFIEQVLKSFAEYVEAGMLGGVSLERSGELRAVGDFLEMASDLLARNEFHPAAAASIAGAALEEFLRGWATTEGLNIADRRGIEGYSQVLREAQLLSRQEAKDVTSWAGLRNAAAHGEWAIVSDRRRVELMIESIKLFKRQHSPAV